MSLTFFFSLALAIKKGEGDDFARTFLSAIPLLLCEAFGQCKASLGFWKNSKLRKPKKENMFFFPPCLLNICQSAMETKSVAPGSQGCPEVTQLQCVL